MKGICTLEELHNAVDTYYNKYDKCTPVSITVLDVDGVPRKLRAKDVVVKITPLTEVKGECLIIAEKYG